AVTRADRVRWRQAVLVGRHAAGRRVGIGRAHHQQAATIGRDGRIRALVEDDGVVLDVTVLREAYVGDTATVAGADVPADPVVLELVVVGACVDADTTRTGRRRGEELIAHGRVADDRIVVHVHVQVEAERQGQVGDVAGLARFGVVQHGRSARKLHIRVFAHA